MIRPKKSKGDLTGASNKSKRMMKFNASDNSRVGLINKVNSNSENTGGVMSSRLEGSGKRKTGDANYLNDQPTPTANTPSISIKKKANSIAKYKQGGVVGKNVKAKESKPMLPKHRELTTDYGQGVVVTHPALASRTKEGVKKEAASYRKSTNNDPFIDTLEERANTRNKMNNERDRKYIKKTIAPKYREGGTVNPLDSVDTSSYKIKKKSSK
jgi:hypothetical protein